MSRSRPIHSRSGTLTRSDSTAKKVCTLPRHAIPLRVTVVNPTLATGATLTLGTTATPALYVSAESCQAAQATQMTMLDGATLEVPTDIMGSIGGTPSAGGPFEVVVEYRYLRIPGP